MGEAGTGKGEPANENDSDSLTSSLLRPFHVECPERCTPDAYHFILLSSPRGLPLQRPAYYPAHLSIYADTSTSLYTATVTRRCTRRHSIKIVPSNRPMNCE